MPYIKPEDRAFIDGRVKDLHSQIADVGQLNYAITQLCRMHLADKIKPNYEAYNSLVGVLECAKLEFYRRAVAKYEDEKIQTNGDVY